MLQIMTIENKILESKYSRFGKKLEDVEEFDQRVNKILQDIEDNGYKVKEIKPIFTYMEANNDDYLNKVVMIVYEVK